jgi:hypothetical protein
MLQNISDGEMIKMLRDRDAAANLATSFPRRWEPHFGCGPRDLLCIRTQKWDSRLRGNDVLKSRE